MFAVAATVVTNTLRTAGRALDKAGRLLEVNPYVESALPSTRIMPYKKNIPNVEGVAFIAPSATVMGRVTLGQGSSVWYGAVIRGDVNTITIGRSVCIGDRAMIHWSGELLQGNPTVIGENVTIGAGAKVHGCVLENECIIGEGSQIMDGAKVSSRSIISPGSIVPKGKVIPSGQLWGGIPAIYMRDLTLQETAAFTTIAVENTKLAAVHAFECAKTWEQIEHEAYDLYQRDERNEFYYKRLTEEEMSVREGEVQNHMVPGRILNTPISARK